MVQPAPVAMQPAVRPGSVARPIVPQAPRALPRPAALPVDGTLRFLTGCKFGCLCGCLLRGLLGGSRACSCRAAFSAANRACSCCAACSRPGAPIPVARPARQPALPVPAARLDARLARRLPCGILRDQFGLPGLFRGTRCFASRCTSAARSALCGDRCGRDQPGTAGSQIGPHAMLGLKGLSGTAATETAATRPVRTETGEDQRSEAGTCRLGLGRGRLLGFQRLLYAQPDLFPRLCRDAEKSRYFAPCRLAQE